MDKLNNLKIMSSDLTIAAKMMKTETGSQHHSMSQVWNVLNEEDWDYLYKIDRAINECQDAPDLYLITAYLLDLGKKPPRKNLG